MQHTMAGEAQPIESPNITREALVAQIAQEQLDTLQASTIEHDFAHIYAKLIPPPPVQEPQRRGFRGKLYNLVGGYHIDLLREMMQDVNRTERMGLDMVESAVEFPITLERALVDIAAKALVHEAYNHPDEKQKTILGATLQHTLETWQRHKEHQTEMYIYKHHRTRGMRKPEEPHHLLRDVATDAVLGGGFKLLEDHLGNLINVHFSKSARMNQLIELGFDVIGADLLRRSAGQFQHYVAVEMARQHPEDLQPYLEQLANHALEQVAGSKHPSSKATQQVIATSALT